MRRKQVQPKQPVSCPDKPRVGGLIEVDHQKWEAFTGGSNYDFNPPLLWTDQRRPTKYEAMKSFKGKLEKGMNQKLGSLHSHNSPITLVDWFTNLADSIQKLGFDTIFRVPSSKGEIYVLQDWGELTSEIY